MLGCRLVDEMFAFAGIMWHSAVQLVWGDDTRKSVLFSLFSGRLPKCASQNESRFLRRNTLFCSFISYAYDERIGGIFSHDS